MLLHSLILDDFFDEPVLLRAAALATTYEGAVSPFDGVLYPDISIEVPVAVVEELTTKLSGLVGTELKSVVPFLRLSVAGVKAPHQAHTDTIMGQYTALIYLNKAEDCQGGTSIVEHVSGFRMDPLPPDELEVWQRDANDPSKWNVVGYCPMRFNRLYLVDSRLFHRSEPIGGFGDSVENGRLVLVCFFSV